MSHFLPLSRVTKLVGISRHALQEMIRGGGLDTFDGMVELNELLRAFPEAKWDDDAEFRRVTEIKEKAFGKRVFGTRAAGQGSAGGSSVRAGQRVCIHESVVDALQPGVVLAG